MVGWGVAEHPMAQDKGQEWSSLSGSQGLIPGSPSLELSVPSEERDKTVQDTAPGEGSEPTCCSADSEESMGKEKEVSASDQPSRRVMSGVKERVPFQGYIWRLSLPSESFGR